MSKIKIFVHEISHVSEGAFDRDREFYTTISSRIVVYCNREKLDFSDIRYWHVVEGLRRSIENQLIPYDHYGYTGDFDENRNRERSNEVFAKEICDKLNSVTGEDSYEVYKLLPYKESQCRDWDKNLYYDPKNSECCYDITSLFLRYPYLEERYDAFLKNNEVYYGYELRQEQVLQAEVFKNLKNPFYNVHASSNLHTDRIRAERGSDPYWIPSKTGWYQHLSSSLQISMHTWAGLLPAFWG